MPDIDTVTHVDRHGVTWKIITAADGQVFGTMDQTGARVYDPEPTDVGPVRPSAQHGADLAAQHAFARQELYERIDKDVLNRTPIPNVVVKERADSSLVWLGLGLLLLMTKR